MRWATRQAAGSRNRATSRRKERIYKAIHEKNAVQRYIARRYLFGFFQRLGFHVMGAHFYEIVPDTRAVASTYSLQPREMPSIDFRFAASSDRFLRLIESYGMSYTADVARFEYQERNDYFRGLDALALYMIVRDIKPRLIVEIGQGFSTRILLAALERNAEESDQSSELVSVDPYSRFEPERAPVGVDFRAIRQPLQTLDAQALLDGCNLLFIDSSHVYKFGSDVEWEFTNLYPRLQPGTILHVHDVFSPYHYPRDWIVEEKRFWNEQYYLESFLAFNGAFEVHLPLHLLARESAEMPQALERLPLPEHFKPDGQSFYVRRR